MSSSSAQASQVASRSTGTSNLGIEIHERLQPGGKPVQRHLIAAAPLPEFLDAAISEVHRYSVTSAGNGRRTSVLQPRSVRCLLHGIFTSADIVLTGCPVRRASNHRDICAHRRLIAVWPPYRGWRQACPIPRLTRDRCSGPRCRASPGGASPGAGAAARRLRGVPARSGLRPDDHQGRKARISAARPAASSRVTTVPNASKPTAATTAEASASRKPGARPGAARSAAARAGG